MRRDRHCLAHPVLGKVCGGRAVWHHRLPLEFGGRSVVENGARLCGIHHHRVHNVAPRLARDLGLLLRRGEDPSQVPVTLAGRVVLLTADGRYYEPTDSGLADAKGKGEGGAGHHEEDMT